MRKLSFCNNTSKYIIAIVIVEWKKDAKRVKSWWAIWFRCRPLSSSGPSGKDCIIYQPSKLRWLMLSFLVWWCWGVNSVKNQVSNHWCIYDVSITSCQNSLTHIDRKKNGFEYLLKQSIIVCSNFRNCLSSKLVLR